MSIRTTEKPNADISDILTVVGCLMLFFSGLARYRFILFMAVFLSIIALSRTFKINVKPLYFVAGPPMFLFLYLDITEGQFIPIFPNLSALVSIASVGIMIWGAEVLSEYYFTKTSKKPHFIVCPRCKYRHAQLTSICNECSFEKKENIEIDSDVVAEDVNNACNEFDFLIKENERLGLRSAITRQVHEMLGLTSDECIIFNFKLSLSHTLRLDGAGVLYKNLILTNQRIILLDYPLWGRGWRKRDSIMLEDIDAVDFEKATEFLANIPYIEFISSGKEYKMRGNEKDKDKFYQIARSIDTVRKAAAVNKP